MEQNRNIPDDYSCDGGKTPNSRTGKRKWEGIETAGDEVGL